MEGSAYSTVRIAFQAHYPRQVRLSVTLHTLTTGNTARAMALTTMIGALNGNGFVPKVDKLEALGATSLPSMRLSCEAASGSLQDRTLGRNQADRRAQGVRRPENSATRGWAWTHRHCHINLPYYPCRHAI